MKIFFGWLLVSLGSTFLSTLAVADTIYDCTLSEPLALDKDGTVFLEQVKNGDADEYTMRLTYTAGLSWIGIGINQEGKSKMAPAAAVIGRADTAVAADDVQFYQMTSDSDDGSGVVPVASNMLHDVSFTQDDATQTSVLQFTHSLTEMNVNDDSMWIFAVGLPDNAWEGKHKVHGSFQLALTEGCVARPVATSAPVTPQPTNNPTNRPTASSPTSKPTTPQEQQPETTTTTSTTTGAPTFPTTSAPTFLDETEASVIAPTSAPSTTSPTTSGIVQPNTVVNINLPSTSNDNDDAESNTTTTTTTTATSQAQSQTQSQPQIQFYDTTHPNKSLWIAHGIVLSIAWGICAPLGIGASILRHPLTAKLGAGKWYQIHFYANVLTCLLTIVGFALAVVATSREGDSHFTGSVHHQAGLAIFILVVVQSVAGYLRPGMPAAASSSRSSAKAGVNGPSTTFKDVEEDSQDSPPTQDAKTLPPTPTKSLSLEPSDDAAAQEATSIKKPLLRKFWEVSHRLMGAVVVGLAWYNCHSGIGLQEENWPSTYNYTNLFWGVTAGISGMIFLVAYVVRMED